MNKWMAALMLGLVAVSIVAIGGAAVSDNVAQVAQAQAMIETNRTAQIGMTSQAITSAGLTVLVIILGLLNVVLLAVVLWLVIRRRKDVDKEQPGGRWKGGPNALWARNEGARDGGQGRIGSGDAVQTLMQLEILRAVNDLRGRNNGQAQLPKQATDWDDEDIPWNG